MARRLRGGSGLRAHSGQTADLTKVVVDEQCDGGSGRTGIRGTDGPLFTVRGVETGEMVGKMNECDGPGFVRVAIGDARVKSFFIKDNRGGAFGWGSTAVRWYQVLLYCVPQRKDTCPFFLLKR